MPFAQWHYPFENEKVFAEHYPAEFICEAIDQTRGWFYTLHAISTMVEDSVDDGSQWRATNAPTQHHDVLSPGIVQWEAVTKRPADANHRPRLHAVQGRCHRAHPVDGKFQGRCAGQGRSQAKGRFALAKCGQKGKLPWLVGKTVPIHLDLEELDLMGQVFHAHQFP